VAEIAYSLVLLGAAATIVRTVGQLMDIDLGVRFEDAFVFEVALPLAARGEGPAAFEPALHHG